MSDEPLFSIHLNIDYPFHLTGILYFPKIHNNFGDSEEQDSALFEPGVCHGSGRGHRAGVSDAAARRDRLAGHPAERVAQLPAKRLQREEDFRATSPARSQTVCRSCSTMRADYESKWDDLKVVHPVRHSDRREVRRESLGFHALEEYRGQVFHPQGVHREGEGEPDRQEQDRGVPLRGRSRGEIHLAGGGQGQGLRRAGDGRPAGQPLHQLV